MASISYGILVCNEHRELDRLLSILVPYVSSEDEIVVLVDQKKATAEVYNVLVQYPHVLKRDGDFDGNFAKWRNFLTSLCSKEWVFQIDADELVSPMCILGMPTLLGTYGSQCDAFALPRVNTVKGLTQIDINRWHWTVDSRGWINYPDHQIRIFRNNENCRFEGQVHEHLTGFKNLQAFSQEFGLYHPKTIERQRMQNALYDTYSQ